MLVSGGECSKVGELTVGVLHSMSSEVPRLFQVDIMSGSGGTSANARHPSTTHTRRLRIREVFELISGFNRRFTFNLIIEFRINLIFDASPVVCTSTILA